MTMSKGKADLLRREAAFLAGMGRVLDLGNTQRAFDALLDVPGRLLDRWSLAANWAALGGDMHIALPTVLVERTEKLADRALRKAGLAISARELEDRFFEDSMSPEPAGRESFLQRLKRWLGSSPGSDGKDEPTAELFEEFLRGMVSDEPARSAVLLAYRSRMLGESYASPTLPDIRQILWGSLNPRMRERGLYPDRSVESLRLLELLKDRPANHLVPDAGHPRPPADVQAK